MKRRCCAVLCDAMDDASAVDGLLWGEKYGSDDLVTAAMEVLVLRFDKIVGLEPFSRLPAPRVLQLLHDDRLMIGHEEQAFDALTTWAQPRHDLPSNALVELLSSLRYATMAADFLRYTVATHALLRACGDARWAWLCT